MSDVQKDRQPRPLPGDEPQVYAAASRPRRTGGSQRQGLLETVIKAFIRSIASSLGRIIARTLTGRGR